MRFVKDHPQYPVELVLRVLEVPSSTFYEWRRRADQPSSRQLEDEQLLGEIIDIHTSSGGTYGAPRMHAMLARRGIGVGRKRVERLMRGAGLQRRVPAPQMADPLDQAGSACYAGAGSGRA